MQKHGKQPRSFTNKWMRIACKKVPYRSHRSDLTQPSAQPTCTDCPKPSLTLLLMLTKLPYRRGCKEYLHTPALLSIYRFGKSYTRRRALSRWRFRLCALSTVKRDDRRCAQVSGFRFQVSGFRCGVNAIRACRGDPTWSPIRDGASYIMFPRSPGPAYLGRWPRLVWVAPLALLTSSVNVISRAIGCPIPARSLRANGPFDR
jgi:hypothetical protein